MFIHIIQNIVKYYFALTGAPTICNIVINRVNERHSLCLSPFVTVAWTVSEQRAYRQLEKDRAYRELEKDRAYRELEKDRA